MLAKEALQNRSREQALAHVGISSSSGASTIEHIAELVEDWEHTYRNVLTEQQRKVHGNCWLALTISHDQIAVQDTQSMVSSKDYWCTAHSHQQGMAAEDLTFKNYAYRISAITLARTSSAS